MIFTADRKTLYESAKTVSRITGSLQNHPELDGILLEADEHSGKIRLTGTDLITFIQKRVDALHVEAGGRTLIRANILAEMTRLMPEDTVSFDLRDDVLRAASGSTEYFLPVIKNDLFPPIDLPFPEDTVGVTGLPVLIKNTVYAASEMENQTAMQGVRLTFSQGDSSASATDGRRMAVTSMGRCADGNLEMILHKKALSVLCDIIGAKEELFVGIAGKNATLFNKNLVFSTRLMDGGFADIDGLLGKISKTYHASLDAGELAFAAGCVSAALQNGDDRCVNLVILDREVKLSSASGTSGAAVPISATDCIPTPASGFNYTPGYLLDYLKKASGPMKLTIDRNGFLLLEANRRKYAVAPRGPVRIAEKEKIAKPKTKKAAKKAAA